MQKIHRIVYGDVNTLNDTVPSPTKGAMLVALQISVRPTASSLGKLSTLGKPGLLVLSF